jgi:hypothetical protein
VFEGGGALWFTPETGQHSDCHDEGWVSTQRKPTFMKKQVTHHTDDLFA